LKVLSRSMWCQTHLYSCSEPNVDDPKAATSWSNNDIKVDGSTKGSTGSLYWKSSWQRWLDGDQSRCVATAEQVFGRKVKVEYFIILKPNTLKFWVKMWCPTYLYSFSKSNVDDPVATPRNATEITSHWTTHNIWTWTNCHFTLILLKFLF
jgi:hypothetical protein